MASGVNPSEAYLQYVTTKLLGINNANVANDPRMQALAHAGITTIEDFLGMHEGQFNSLTSDPDPTDPSATRVKLREADCRTLVALSAFIHDKFRARGTPVHPKELTKADYDQYRVDACVLPIRSFHGYSR